MKPLQIAPENAGNCISVALKLKIFRGSMPPDPSRFYLLIFDWPINKNRKLFRFVYVGSLKLLLSFSENPEVCMWENDPISQANFCPILIPQVIFSQILVTIPCFCLWFSVPMIQVSFSRWKTSVNQYPFLHRPSGPSFSSWLLGGK